MIYVRIFIITNIILFYLAKFNNFFTYVEVAYDYLVDAHKWSCIVVVLVLHILQAVVGKPLVDLAVEGDILNYIVVVVVPGIHTGSLVGHILKY
jgi:hypothetical protein